MPENRIDLILGVKDDQFRRGMANARADAEKTGAAIDDAFEDAGNGIDKAGEAVGGLKDDFAALAGQVANLNLGSLVDQVSEFASGVSDSAQQALGTFSEAGEGVREFELRVKAAYASAADQSTVINAAKELQQAYGKAFSLDGAAEGIQTFTKFGASAKQAAEDLARAAKVARTESKGLSDVAEPLAEALRADSFDPGVFEEISTQLGIGGEALGRYGAKLDENKKVVAESREEQLAAQAALRAYIDENERYAGVADRVKTAQGEAQAEVQKFNQAAGEQINEFKELLAEGVLPFLRYFNSLPDSFKAFVVGSTAVTGAAATVGGKLAQLYGIVKLASGAGGLAGIGTAATAAAASTTAATSAMFTGAVEAEAAFAAASTTAGTAATATAGLATSIAGVGAAAIVAAVGINEYNKGVIEAEEAEQALLDTEARALVQNKARVSAINETAEALIKAAALEKTSTEERIALTNAIIAKMGEVSKAEQDGDKEAKAAAKADEDALRKRRADLDEDAARQKKLDDEAKKSIEDRFEAGKKAFEDYKKAVSAGEFDSKDAQASALNGIIGNLDGDALKEARAAAKKLNAELVADRLDSLDKIAEAEHLSGDELKARAEQLLNQYRITGDARIKIEQEVGDKAKAIDEATAARRKALDEESLNLKRSALQLDAEAGKLADEKIANLQGQLDKGKDVTGELERELKGRAANQKRLIEAEATLDRITLKQKAAADAAADPGNAERIQEQAAEREQQLNQRTAQAKADIDRQLGKDLENAEAKRAANKAAAEKRSADLERERADLALRGYDQARAAEDAAYQQERAHLEELARLGTDTSAELQRLDDERDKAERQRIQERAQLEVDAIAKRRDAENKGADKDTQALNNERARLDIEKAIQQARQDTNAIVDRSTAAAKDELVANLEILQALKDQNAERDKAGKKQGFKSSFTGAAYSPGDINANLSGFGVSRREYSDGEARAADGRTQREVERDIARQRGMLGNRENVNAGRFGAANAVNMGPPPMTSDQGAQLISLLQSLVQQGKARSQAPSTLANDFSRGFQRSEGIG